MKWIKYDGYSDLPVGAITISGSGFDIVLDSISHYIGNRNYINYYSIDKVHIINSLLNECKSDFDTLDIEGNWIPKNKT